MMRSRSLSALAIVLAVCVGLGSIVSVAFANDMALKMAVSGDMSDSETDLCPACGNNLGNDGMIDCSQFCNLAQGAILSSGSASRVVDVSAFVEAPASFPRETIGGIEPSPPKPTILR